ncbi:MAG: methyltransferase domain-containing protein [Sedimentisphaerales bacterium]|nr:methyltransferase domain-containing protein [Sedimentisphaerales bacterium]
MMNSRNESEKQELEFPINLGDEEEVVRWISGITGRDEQAIRDNLRREFEQPGANVVKAFAEASLSPYTWSEELVKFYERADAFIYELVLWNRNSLKRRMRSYIAKYLCQYEGTGRKVLCVGDGLGFDSFYFAQKGQKVTYYEVPGFSHRFASRLFSPAGADIKIASEPQQIPSGYFDAVVCLDVLEHVRDAPAFVKQLVSFIRPGGVLIVHAPFYMIHPSNPTHLKANRKYSGSIKLYTDCGLKLINGRFFWNPLIFEKISENVKPRTPQRSALGMFSIKLGGLYLSLGRFSVLPFLWIDSYRKSHSRWFEENAKFKNKVTTGF